MVELTKEITFDARVSDVYDAVVDFESRTAWQPNLINVGLTAGNPVRTGTMVAMTKKFMMGDVFVNVDVTELQRNKVLTLKGMHGRFSYERNIEFTPMGSSTQVVDTITLDVGWLWFWYRPFLENALSKAQMQEWQALREHLNG